MWLPIKFSAQQVKHMLQGQDKPFPGAIETMFSALQNVVPSHLADHKAFNIVALATQGAEYAGGDQDFDLRSSSTDRAVNE
ncbi:MAG: tRNA 2-thiocytidine biosynthesis protein TtcA [Paraglaciecola sp.]|jgi:tRNA 2-thiocytidine biosynthesis protein TtcA